MILLRYLFGNSGSSIGRRLIRLGNGILRNRPTLQSTTQVLGGAFGLRRLFAASFFLGSTCIMLSLSLVVILSIFSTIPIWLSSLGYSKAGYISSFVEYIYPLIKVIAVYSGVMLTVFTANHFQHIPDFVANVIDPAGPLTWLHLPYATFVFAFGVIWIPFEQFIHILWRLPDLGMDVTLNHIGNSIFFRELSAFPYSLWVLIKAIPTYIGIANMPTWVPTWIGTPIIEGIAISVGSTIVIWVIKLLLF